MLFVTVQAWKARSWLFCSLSCNCTLFCVWLKVISSWGEVTLVVTLLASVITTTPSMVSTFTALACGSKSMPRVFVSLSLRVASTASAAARSAVFAASRSASWLLFLRSASRADKSTPVVSPMVTALGARITCGSIGKFLAVTETRATYTPSASRVTSVFKTVNSPLLV